MDKPKVAFYWCASCGGCEEAVVDLNEDILKVTEAVDIVLWPVAMDFKYEDVEKIEDKSIAVSFVNGAIRLSEQEEVAKLLRRKSQLLVAFGSCAHLGGIPGLANFWDRESIFNRAYHEVPSVDNEDGVQPQTVTKVEQGELHLPEFYDTVRTLDQVTDVDYYLPGCAPPPDLIMGAVTAVLKGELPPKGTVLAPKKSLCETCPRAESKPESFSIEGIRRPHEIIADPKKCFLEEGLICLGPVTRSGCGERCINANMPCRGCFGPPENAADQGGKMITALASILQMESEETISTEEIRKSLSRIPDLVGTLYRFSLPSSLLSRKVMRREEEE